MNTLEFRTSTKIDLLELVTLGLGSKRGVEGKIGHKGSGMKFILAMLHRLGSRLEVLVNGHRWVSDTRTILVRGIEHHVVVLMNHTTGEEMATHISVNAGADTWLEPWFVLRELLQNTIDEGGVVNYGIQSAGNPDGTTMRIVLTESLAAAWADRDDWHNARQKSVIYEGPKPGLFYHGFLIYTDRSWRRSYDVTDVIKRENLSEDRQLRNVDMGELFRKILMAAPALPSSLYSDLLCSGLERAADTSMIGDAVYHTIADDNREFGGFKLSMLEAAFIAKHGERACFTQDGPQSQEVYYAEGAGYKPVHVEWFHQRMLRYSKVIKSAESLVPELTSRLIPVSATALKLDALDKLKLALKITKRLRPQGCSVTLVKAQHATDRMRVVGLADVAANKVMLTESHVEAAPLLDLVNTLVEEFMHIRSKGSDCTRQFETALVQQIAVMLMPKVKQTADVL